MKTYSSYLTKSKLPSILLALTLLCAFSSCKKEGANGGSTNSPVKTLEGNYKGTLNDYTKEYYDAIIVITDAGGGKVKIAPKSGEAYSHVTPVTVPAQYVSPQAPSEGVYYEGPEAIYTYKANVFNIATKKIKATDVIWHYTGTKQ